MSKLIPSAATRRSMMMAAVVVGAALTSIGSNTSEASQPDHRAVTDISRYCQACWRNARLHPDSWTDCTQEVLVRLLERVEPQAWNTLLKSEGEDRREFLRAIDAVKKRTQRAHKFSGYAEETADNRHQPETARNELREQLEQASREALSFRQQRILQLTCDGWTIPEIADELQTTVERISDEKYKAIRKMRKQLNGSANS